MARKSSMVINFETDKFPCCIVWTPIPILTYLFPFIGHMGIAMSDGVIRDFAGPYFVSEDNMAFGRPTRYLQLHPENELNGILEWDDAVRKASTTYQSRMHNLCCDNCHSHVALALNTMRYKGSSSWNMITLAAWMFIFGKYVSFMGFLKTWLPSIVLYLIIALTIIFL